MVSWRTCSKEPPIYEGEYQVLILEHDWVTDTKHWVVLPGKYYKNGDWDLWIDGFGWSGDSGYKPYYWCELPPFPPIPYEGPYCEYYKGEYCSAQKNTPRCVCQGNRKACMYFD